MKEREKVLAVRPGEHTWQPRNDPQRFARHPFNKLVLSQSNVRSIKTGVSIEELAEDIARRTLLQSLNCSSAVSAGALNRHVRDPRRRAALSRAGVAGSRQKRWQDRAHPLRRAYSGLAEEDSHGRERGSGPVASARFNSVPSRRFATRSRDDEIPRGFSSPCVVKQRLRLAAVSETLLDVYAEDRMTWEQLMAFTVSEDHNAPEQVWEALARSYSRDAYQIRQQLTQNTVRVSDSRWCLSASTYHLAGGVILNDLFNDDAAVGCRIPRCSIASRLDLKRDAEPLRARDGVLGIVRRPTTVSTCAAL